MSFITGKSTANEAIKNVIDERNNDKVKSLEEARVFKKGKFWKKKSKVGKFFRNETLISNAAESLNINKTITPMKEDPRSSRNVHLFALLSDDKDNREKKVMSPVNMMRTLSPNENGRNFLKPIHTM